MCRFNIKPCPLDHSISGKGKCKGRDESKGKYKGIIQQQLDEAERELARYKVTLGGLDDIGNDEVGQKTMRTC
jgi:hypothetical protein